MMFGFRTVGETVTLSEALQRGVLDPTSAIFNDPRTKVVFSIDKAIAHGLMDETGHHTHYRTKESMTLQVNKIFMFYEE